MGTQRQLIEQTSDQSVEGAPPTLLKPQARNICLHAQGPLRDYEVYQPDHSKHTPHHTAGLPKAFAKPRRFLITFHFLLLA